MLIDKKLRLQVSVDTSTTSPSHCIWFCIFSYIWILFIPLSCSKLHHLLRLFRSLANDEIIGYMHRSSSEGKTMKSIHVCAHERAVLSKIFNEHFSIIVISESMMLIKFSWVRKIQLLWNLNKGFNIKVLKVWNIQEKKSQF